MLCFSLQVKNVFGTRKLNVFIISTFIRIKGRFLFPLQQFLKRKGQILSLFFEYFSGHPRFDFDDQANVALPGSSFTSISFDQYYQIFRALRCDNRRG